MSARFAAPSSTRPIAERFPPAGPLDAFFRWNEARLAKDRRYVISRDILALMARLGGGEPARAACLAHLTAAPVVRWRLGRRLVTSRAAVENSPAAAANAPPAALAAASSLVDRLLAGTNSADAAAHAAVFQAFEALAGEVDLHALARHRPRAEPAARRSGNPEILVIKLGALGDLVQALGTVPEIRRHHAGARITLLTTAPFAEFVRWTGLFDAVLVDPRPRWSDMAGWLHLGRMLRRPRFERVYDLQTSDRTSLYAWLMRRRRAPEWSGIAWRCSHPHANLDRDREHTLDRQAEQLLMAGIYPVPDTEWLPPVPARPPAGVRPPFALLIPGSSPGHPEKRWPAPRYAELARWLHGRGCRPVIVGVHGEEDIAGTITASCPAAIDLVGQTDIASLTGLAREAALTVGNDTGATHVAAAAGANPVLVLFSQASEPRLCAPRGAHVRVLPSTQLDELGIETVTAAAGEALGKTPAEAGTPARE